MQIPAQKKKIIFASDIKLHHDALTIWIGRKDVFFRLGLLKKKEPRHSSQVITHSSARGKPNQPPIDIVIIDLFSRALSSYLFCKSLFLAFSFHSSFLPLYLTYTFWPAARLQGSPWLPSSFNLFAPLLPRLSISTYRVDAGSISLF